MAVMPGGAGQVRAPARHANGGLAMTTALTPNRQTQPTTATVTGPLVATIEHTWAAIQDRHPEVRHVVLTLGNGSHDPGN
jgi:hypothetical protein